MSLAGKKVAVIFANGFEDHELTEPVEAIRDEGGEAMLIGLSGDDKSGVEGKHGTIVRADATINEVNSADFDMLLVPGGKGPARLRQDERILEFVRRFDQEGKPIAAICHGPQVLVSAGILEGRTATSYFAVGDEIKGAGANFVNKPLVVDGNLITSRQVQDIPQFIGAIFNALEHRERKTA